jgi:serine/threonine-protein kinase HipA
MLDRLHVHVHGIDSGVLFFEQDTFVFRYQTQEHKNYISLTMLVRSRDYLNTELHPIFEMHLPEGYLLSIIKKHFSKIVKIDDFTLLKLMSPSIRGRVTYASDHDVKKDDLTLGRLLHSKDANLFDELVNRFALHSALSGVQPKVLATVQDKATLSTDQYIVKSWGEDYPHLGLNEYYCMMVVKHAGVPVPDFYLSDDHKLFIMKRFDLDDENNYLGFEDMCVLQAKQRDDKYEGSYESVSKTIKTFVSPKYIKESLSNFFKMIVINHFVKNGDAHLKNFGLLYRDIDDIMLAPAYDVVSTAIYIKNDIQALNLLGSKKWWDKRFLLRFGIESCDLSKSEAERLYDECLSAAELVINEMEMRLKKETDQAVSRFLEKLIEILKVY